MNKIVDFTDLIVWQKSHQLVLDVYAVTKNFPQSETVGLASQMQRSAVSITSNIAEGFARRSKKEKMQFYYTALASLSELRNQFFISRDLHYINLQAFDVSESKMLEVRKLLNGFIRTSSNYNN